MRYVGKVYRPPSEANAYILQATIGCSWNKCTYCDMYRDKPQFRLRNLDKVLEDMRMAAAEVETGVIECMSFEPQNFMHRSIQPNNLCC